VEEDATNRLTGPIHGAAVQAHTIHGGVHVHLPANEADTPSIHCAPPSTWDDAGSLPSGVRALLQAQIEAARELPYRLLPGARRPSLDTVYVRQGLGSGLEEPPAEQNRPTPILDSRGQLVDAPSGPIVRVAVRPPARTVREALDDDDYLLVTGGPGQGKSTLSLRLAAMVAEHALSPTRDRAAAPLAEPVIPLRLPARELATRLDQTFPDALAGSAAAEYNRLLATPPTASVLRARVAGCRWLLLVDGLDEIADGADRDNLVTALTGWAAQDNSPYRFVLTTRPIEGAALAPLQRIGAARYELQPFDDKALRRFADHWFEDSDLGYRFVRQIREAHLDELVRVPLLATIAAIIFENQGTRPLPDNQYELYESYLKYLRTAHQVAPGPFDGICDSLLQHLGRVRVDFDTSLVAAARDWTRKRLPNLTGDWEELLVTHLAKVGPLTRRGEDLSFLHHSFAEHLAATAEARLFPETFDSENPDFARRLHAARPKERGRHARAVLLHYTRLHPAQANRLISWLHGGGADQHLLAARLLAAHAPADTEVVDAFLVTVRAWALTNQPLSNDILEQTSRAAHHPGIATWLTDLAGNEEAPWESRVEAAAALATRLRGPESADAVTLLTTVIDDNAVPVRHRLAAAEALSECGVEEQESAARGLRAVLADPDATGWDCRTAGVVLAGFEGVARQHAVTALTEMLDDPWLPDDDRADVASGLVEISAAFHARCAHVFRAILDNRTDYQAGRRDAAVGMASLGPQQLAEAVAILTSIVKDRRLRRNSRLRTAAILAELGPEHRLTAGRLILDISAEFDMRPHETRNIASHLANVGFHEHAAKMLRAVLSEFGPNPNSRLWAARDLAAIGPEYREEAIQEFHRVANDSRSGEFDRTAALAELANSGEPRRTPALASLRTILADLGAAPSLRCQAARELIRFGPEFHGEVIDHLTQIASSHPAPDVQYTVWSTISDLGASTRHRATAALADLIAPESKESWDSYGKLGSLHQFSTSDDKDGTAVALTALLCDPTRSGDTRSEAAAALVTLSRRFHQVAVNGLVDMFLSQSLSNGFLGIVIGNVSGFGTEPRRKLAKTLRDIVRLPFSTPEAIVDAAETLTQLNRQPDPEITTSLRKIVDDDAAAPDDRAWAAVVLARAVPEELATATTVVLRCRGRWASTWDRHVRTLAAWGADVTPHLRQAMTDANARHSWREVSAVTLSQLCPDLREQAVAELRAQSNDEFLGFTSRVRAMVELGQLDATTRTATIEYCRAVLNDEHRPVSDRCQAARQLAELDESARMLAMTALSRFATSPQFTVEERWEGVNQIGELTSRDSPETTLLTVAVAQDPAATASLRIQALRRLSGRPQLEMQRSLLIDRTALPDQRVSGVNAWFHQGLAEKAEMVLRDIITAVDSTHAERIEAASSLGFLAPRHIPEAMRFLKELVTGRHVPENARVKLASLSLTERHRILAEAELTIADETRPARERRDAAMLICQLRSNPPLNAAEYLRQLARDPRTSETERVRIRYLLRQEDGLGQLRAIRDNERTPPAIRWAAANQLCDYDTADRTAGARVLNRIATDSTCRPALRWNAARDLTNFGARGQELAEAALLAIITNDALPTTARVNAAETLGSTHPDRRAEMLRLLHRLRGTGDPRTRVHTLRAIGQFDPTEATLALAEIAASDTQTPALRLHAAVAMVHIRRDYREEAAVTARNIAYDAAAPWHIRLKAARQLSRWSEPCRGDAQTLLTTLLNKS
jgi:cellulose synthase operon protein C